MTNYSLGVYEKSMPNTYSIKEKLQLAKDTGFDYMELSIDESQEKLARLDWTESEIQALYLAQREVGLPIRSICLSAHRSSPLGHPDALVRDRSQIIMQKAIHLASALGIRLIQLAGYDVYYEESSAETRALFIDGLQQSVAYASKYGVMLGFETMETEFMNTVEKSMVYVSQVNSPYLNIYPDIGNLTNAALLYGHDVKDDLNRGQGHLAAVHLKETVPGVFREVPFGQGHVDFVGAIQCAQKQGVGMFVGEFWYTGQENVAELLQTSHDYLRAAFAQANQ